MPLSVDLPPIHDSARREAGSLLKVCFGITFQGGDKVMIRPLILAAALAAAFSLPASAGKGPDPPLSSQDAKRSGWKAVYSNDGKELGKVTRLDSSAENKATQLYTDIGGATGSGKHQVILPATRFSPPENDRIVIDMTAAQASKDAKDELLKQKSMLAR